MFMAECYTQLHRGLTSSEGLCVIINIQTATQKCFMHSQHCVTLKSETFLNNTYWYPFPTSRKRHCSHYKDEPVNVIEGSSHCCCDNHLKLVGLQCVGERQRF